MPFWRRNKSGRGDSKPKRKIAVEDVMVTALAGKAYRLFVPRVAALLNANPAIVKNFCIRYPATSTREEAETGLTLTIPHPARVGLSEAIQSGWVANEHDLETLLALQDYSFGKKSVIGNIIPACKEHDVIRNKAEYNEVIAILRRSVSWADTHKVFPRVEQEIKYKTITSPTSLEHWLENIRRSEPLVHKPK